MWKPVSDDHSIESMSAVISFVEPVSSLVYRKMIREFERTTFDQGLNNRQPMQAFEFKMDGGVPSPVQQVLVNGMIFQKHSLVRDVTGAVVNRLVEQLQFQPQVIHYTAWKYVSWTQALATINKIILPALKIALDSVALGVVRLEYIDRFIYEGASGDITAKGVIREDSDLISAHIFKASDLWHSHTGKFETLEPSIKRLFQVNVDAQELLGPAETKRSISVMTAVEDRFEQTGLVVEDDVEEVLSSRLSSLHESVIDLFKGVVDSTMTKKVGMV
ncbi:hypothetical protein [Phyllobacterium sp. SB3]|uniref:hypothetical protein n=1 Tax=Phyllobacterium sp. SB3 TaxID=3156073 RepID=UPI0032AFB25D